jgi:hypothetical protein
MLSYKNMAETGCLKDGHFQNLSCEGKFMYHNNDKPTVFQGAVVNEGKHNVHGQLKATNIAAEAGGDIGNSVHVMFPVTTHGRIHTCNTETGNAVLEFHRIGEKEYIGNRYTFIQKKTLNNRDHNI